jgi:hypothetical protein
MTTTDIVLHSGRALAVEADFAKNYPAIAPTEATMQLMADILGEETLEMRNLPTVKCPPGDADAFTYTAGGRNISTKRIKGFMLHYVAQRAFWKNPDPSNNPPDCASSDNKQADPGGQFARGSQDNPTGLCGNCPMSQKGTDLKGGRMAACKEQRRLFVVLKGLLLPIIIAAPPSSIGGLKDFLVSMAMTQQGWWLVPLEFSLEKATSAAGQTFNKIVVAAEEEAVALGDNEREAIESYREYIKELVTTQPPVFETDAPSGGFTVGDAEDAEPEMETAPA